jgi:Zn-dependent alcohol dehydrogenase
VIATLLSVITSRLAGPIALAGCAVLSLLLIGAKLETGQVRADLKAQVAESRKLAADLGTCRANVASLDGALTVQNEAVAALKADGDRMAQAAKKAASDALRARNDADRYARKLATFTPGETCEAREANVADLIEGLDR